MEISGEPGIVPNRPGRRTRRLAARAPPLRPIHLEQIKNYGAKRGLEPPKQGGSHSHDRGRLPPLSALSPHLQRSMTPFSASSRPLASCSCFFRSWISSSASAARERAGDRARYHSVTQLKAGAFQMFHRVCRVTERPRAPRIVPNRPRGCSLCLGAHGRFGGAVCAPFGGSGRSQALRISPRRTTYAKHGPQLPKFILTDF